MNKLTGIEKLKLEKLFNMDSGYVLNFSNRTIQNFILEYTGKDIFDEKYVYGSGSKAYRLRAFWNKEPAPIVGKLITGLLEYWKTDKQTQGIVISSTEQSLYDECLKIADKLKHESIAGNIDVLQTNSYDRNFQLLSKSIRESIEKNDHELAVDRLHTFVVRYIRELCKKYSVSFDNDTPLHSLFGGYIKHLQKYNIIESEMTERILKSSISVLEAFNDVRNNKSLAHDNQILNHKESTLILNDIINIIQFIEAVESSEQIRVNEVNSIPF